MPFLGLYLELPQIPDPLCTLCLPYTLRCTLCLPVFHLRGMGVDTIGWVGAWVGRASSRWLASWLPVEGPHTQTFEANRPVPSNSSMYTLLEES
jgi:hypothetical protein